MTILLSLPRRRLCVYVYQLMLIGRVVKSVYKQAPVYYDIMRLLLYFDNNSRRELARCVHCLILFNIFGYC